MRYDNVMVPRRMFMLFNFACPCFIYYTRPSVSSSESIPSGLQVDSCLSQLLCIGILWYLTLRLSTTRLKISQTCHIHTVTSVIPCFCRISIRPILKIFSIPSNALFLEARPTTDKLDLWNLSPSSLLLSSDKNYLHSTTNLFNTNVHDWHICST